MAWAGGVTGSREGLKIPWRKLRAGSIPAPPTKGTRHLPSPFSVDKPHDSRYRRRTQGDILETLIYRLKKSGIWNADLEWRVRALWKYGIEPISDPRLRSTIEGFLLLVPLAFFTDHASRSGNFHPPWQNVAHGTFLSIVESCVLLPGWARHVPEILDAGKNPSQRAIDLGLAATIVSDCWKKEDYGDIHHGTDHGRVAAEHWVRFATSAGLDRDTIERVAEASVMHMGVYAPDWKQGTKLSPIAALVNLPDVATSLPQLRLIYRNATVIR